MSHENRRILIRVALRNETLDLIFHQQVTRKPNDAAEFVLAGRSSEEGDGAALREAAQNDALRRDTRGNLSIDQGVEVAARAQDARFIFSGRKVADGSLWERVR